MENIEKCGFVEKLDNIVYGLVCCSDTATECNECPYREKGTGTKHCSNILMEDAYKMLNSCKSQIKLLESFVIDYKSAYEKAKTESIKGGANG